MAAITLCDLDDACLLLVFKQLEPLPDLYNLALSCHRFRRLTGDKRMWRVVAPLGARPELTPWGRAGGGPVYPTLLAAVESSRPGDTIWLSPGQHHVSGVAIPWPLHLVGGGARPEDSLLISPQGADCGLAIASTAKVANLSFRSTLAPCVVHERGCLRIERCLLRCDARGLDHLVAPLLTRAMSGKVKTAAAAPPPRAHARAQQSQQLLQPPFGQPATTAAPPAAATLADAGAGRLSVVECRLLGGASAVQCDGTGSLQGVRVIYEPSAAFFWLEVDSSVPGRIPAGRRRGAAAAAAAVAAARLGGSTTQPPAGAGLGSAQAVKGEVKEGPLQADCALGGGVGSQHGARHAEGATADAGCSSVCWPPPVLPHPDWPPATTAPSAPLPLVAAPAEPRAAAAAEGLARIQAVLGKRAIHPDMMAAHLQERSRQRGAQ